MSVRPHPTHPGWYIVDYYPNGRRGKRERQVLESYEEAQQFQDAIGKTATASPIHPKISDALPAYLEWVKDKQAPVTYEQKERRWRRWLGPFFGKYRIKELSQRLFDDYEKTVSKTQYQVDVAHIQALIKWMIKRKMATALDWKPEVTALERQVKLIPDPVDLLRFVDAIPVEMHKIICLFILYGGLRLAEVRRLRWEDYQGGDFLCRKTKTKQPYVQPIPEPIQPWFDANKQATGFVFSVNGGLKPICNITLSIMKARKASGIYMSSHLFRHASATFLYEQTDDIYAVQQHLRHSKPSTSQIYTRYSAERRKTRVQSVVDYVVHNENPVSPQQ